jgi:hypothetical protein
MIIGITHDMTRHPTGLGYPLVMMQLASWII